MNKIIYLDIKRGVCNIGWLTAVLAAFVILYRPLREIPVGEIHVLELVTLPMALSGFSVFAASFPTLGYSNSFYSDYSTGYIRFILTRMSWKKYGVMRMISVGISGGLTLMVPFSLIFAICYGMGHQGSLNGLYEGMQIERFIERYGVGTTLLAKLILGFLFGALWALVGYCVSLFILNKYVAVICPFVIYQLMWLLLFPYRVINPIYLMRGDDLDSYPLSGFMLLLYICLTCILIMYKLGRRVKDE